MYWGTGLSPMERKIKHTKVLKREDALSFLAGMNLELAPSGTMTNVLGSNHLYIDPNKEYLF